MSGPDAEHEAPAEVEPGAEAKPSGLRNPTAAVRGVGAGALALEALVLLMTLVPIHVLHVRHAGAAMLTLGILALLCVLLAGLLKRPWAWTAGIVLQVALIACGWFHISLAILGVLFLLVWLYALSVRRSVLGK